MFCENYEALPDQCRSCAHLKVFSLRMDGNHSYSCHQYPRKPNDEICPAYTSIVDALTPKSNIRLIDANALQRSLFDYAPPEMVWDRGDIEHKVSEAPTIEAIPLWWINDYCGRNEYDGAIETVAIIETMVDRWHKGQAVKE